MAFIRLLLVDDDEVTLLILGALLQEQGFEVTTASTVSAALKLISSRVFDVLLSDLHMPGAGDGLTVVSAMRHANPEAVTILLSSFPEMSAATQAILLQTDQILVKPVDIGSLVEAIKQRLADGHRSSRVIEDLATILERSTQRTIDAWLALAEKDEKLMIVPLERLQRSGHLPQLLDDLVNRLRYFQPLARNEVVSVAAHDHGVLRHRQGYSAAMMVEEARLLQVSVFETLQANMINIDFSVLLNGVMAIADEIDSQLSQAVASYDAEGLRDSLREHGSPHDSEPAWLATARLP
jgi:ActR/RegA family two-component response regulator